MKEAVGKRAQRRHRPIACVTLVLGLSAGSLQAYTDNGFETGWLYGLRGSAGNRALYAFDEVTGELMQTLLPVNTAWNSLTFAGTGNNDARLFLIRGNTASGANDVQIAELDATGATVKSTSLQAIYANTPGKTYPADHTDLFAWCIRYSYYHNSLFIGVNPNRSGGSPGYVHEVNLALDTVLNTYTVETLSSGDQVVNLDVNGYNGDLYVMVFNAPSYPEGALMKIDTVEPGKGTVTTLINGATEGGAWTNASLSPYGIVYRGINNPENEETLLIICSGSAATTSAPVLEYYVNQVDTDGNLKLRQASAFTMTRFPGPAQRDEVDGRVMVCRQANQQTGQHNAGIDQYLADDVHYRPAFVSGVNNLLLDNAYYDAASPGFMKLTVAPTTVEEIFAAVGGTPDPGSVQFSVRNKAYSGEVSYTVAESPDVGWLSLDKSGGTIPVMSTDTVTASLDATGLSPGVHTATVRFTETSSGRTIDRTITLRVVETMYQVTPEPGFFTVGHCAGSLARPFTITKLSGRDFSYTIEGSDASGNPASLPSWLQLSKTSGGPLTDANPSDTVWVSINPPAPANGTVAYLKFIADKASTEPYVLRWVEVRVVSNVQTFVYGGDVDPESDDAFGPGFKFYVAEGIKQGGLVTLPRGTGPYQSWNGRAYEIVKNASDPPTVLAHMLNNGDGVNTVGAAHDPWAGATIVARLRVAQGIDQGSNLMIHRPGQSGWTAARILWGGEGVLSGMVRDYDRFLAGNAPHTSDDTGARDEFVILRVAAGTGHYGSSTVAVYLNENPTPILLNTHAGQGPAINARTFGWGIQAPGGQGTLTVDWVTATNAGMFAPGEELQCTGVSLIPVLSECHTPSMDIDGDSDVDMDDFAEYQRCFTGLAAQPDLSSRCRCFDTNGDDRINRMDLEGFIQCQSRSGVPADPDCGG